MRASRRPAWAKPGQRCSRWQHRTASGTTRSPWASAIPGQSYVTPPFAISPTIGTPDPGAGSTRSWSPFRCLSNIQVQFPRPTSSRTTVTDVNVCPTFVRCSSRKGACRVQPAVTRTFLPRSRWGRVAHSVEIRSFCHFLQSHTAKSHLHLQLRFPPTFSPTMLKEWYTTASAAGTAPLVGHCPRAGRAIPSQMEI